jgi:hypothetical protein
MKMNCDIVAILSKQLSQEVPADADLLCDKTAMLKEMTK